MKSEPTHPEIPTITSAEQAHELVPGGPCDAGVAATKRLIVMMPALNEARTVANVIQRVPREIPGIDEVMVVVIDDGSTDDTVAAARGAGAEVVRHRRNRGVGAALQSGLSFAINHHADFVVNIDSDGQFAPEDIPKLLGPVLRGEADMATASRFADKALVPKMPWVKRVGNAGMAAIVSRICGQRFCDVSCGFRAYSRETLLRLVLTGRFTYTQETFLVLSLSGFGICEVPIAVRGVREHGKSRVASNLFRYAYNTVSIILGSVRNYRPAALFNGASAVLLLAAFGFGAFFLWHRAVAGKFWPHTWAGFVGAFFFGLALLVFSMGQVAMMIARLRFVQDEQLYLLRRHLLARRHSDSDAAARTPHT